MNTAGANYVRLEGANEVERTPKARRVVGGIKYIIEKIMGAPSIMDADAIFKSKDWPYLWRK